MTTTTLSDFSSVALDGHPPGRIAVGFWSTGAACPLPKPAAGSCTLTTAERSALVLYLTGEHHRVAYMGFSDCRCCGKLNGTEDVDDGIYVWPSGLAHYVLAHRVALPLEFVSHCLAGGRPPVLETIEGWAPARVLRGGIDLCAPQTAAGLGASPGAVQARLRRLLDEVARGVSAWPYDAVPVRAEVRDGRVVAVEITGPGVRVIEETPCR